MSAEQQGSPIGLPSMWAEGDRRQMCPLSASRPDGPFACRGSTCAWWQCGLGGTRKPKGPAPSSEPLGRCGIVANSGMPIPMWPKLPIPDQGKA